MDAKKTNELMSSNVSQMIKSHGINSDSGSFTNDPIIGDYYRIDPPHDWREILIEAAANTFDMSPMTDRELGGPDDWLWYQCDETDDSGFRTGVTWLVAQVADPS